MNNIICTKDAPQPIGPYVQGIRINNLIITSGQIPLDINGKIISDNLVQQTEQVLHNIKKIIEEAGCKINDIVKITIFVTNLDKIDDINHVYEKFFIKHKSPYPTRTCVEVSKLPKNAKIEIEAIAIKNK